MLATVCVCVCRFYRFLFAHTKLCCVHYFQWFSWVFSNLPEKLLFFSPIENYVNAPKQASKQIIIIMNDESICLKIWKNINFINFKRHSFYELNLKGGKFAFWGQKALMFLKISKLLHLRDICEYFSIFFSCNAKL